MVRNVSAEDGTILTEFRARGTNSGPMNMGAGEQPPTGRPIDVMFCQVAVVRDGTIADVRLYYDAMTFASQLGLMPSTAAAG